MLFDQLIFENLQRTALKKVRIKIDPAAIGVAEDLKKCDGYEGYVLSEDSTISQVIVAKPDQNGNPVSLLIPTEYLELIRQEILQQKLDKLKEFIILSLNLQQGDPIIPSILSCNNLDDIDAFLRDKGLTESDILKLYKYFSIYE